MGFGLLALGYIFLCFYTTGADLIGYIIMLFSFKKLLKIEKSFKKCIVAVAILIPVGLYNLLGFVDLAFNLGILGDYDYELPFEKIESSENVESSDISEIVEVSDEVEVSVESSSETLTDEKTKIKNKYTRIANSIFNALFIFGSLCFHYFFYQSANKLSAKVSVPKLGFKANINMVINIVFFSVWGFLTAGGANVAALNIVTILHFPIIILNFIYIYSCYATYAFESETEENEDE